MLKQKTLKDSFSLSGKGLHTGLDLTVTFNPAPDNHGYKIQRIDVEGQPTIDAVADNVTETTRGTVLSKNGVKVSTIEHGMAALYALGIDNCLIQVNGPEFPILDGSAQYYVQEIERVGTVEQNAVKDFYIIKSKIEFRDETTGSSIIVLPDENFSLNVLVSYDSTIIPNQFATLEDMHNFKDEVAASRTFVFVREIEPLLSAGLIKGGDLDNAIVIYERKMSQESFDKLADVMGVPHMDADQLGYINHKPLVWPNECARHKLLDVIGDLALIGKPIKGRIIATRPGHTINNKFARQMRKEIRLHEIQAPSYDCFDFYSLAGNSRFQFIHFSFDLVDTGTQTSNFIFKVLHFQRKFTSQCLDFINLRQHRLQLEQCLQFLFYRQLIRIFFCFSSHFTYKYFMGFVFILLNWSAKLGNKSRIME